MRINRKESSTKVQMIKEWVICIVIAAVVVISLNKFLIFKIYVPTGSMIPTINEEDQLFVSRIYNYDNIERGDILVFKSIEKNETLIKRVIGLPGETVNIKSGVVSVNGKEVQEDYVKYNDVFSGEYQVPKDKYFFLGDNRINSNDARFWKNPYIDQEDIEAKAQIKVYPFSDFGFVQ